MIRLDKNNFIPWISIVFLLFAYSIGTGLYITIQRVTYYPIFESKIVSVLLTIFSSSLMTLYNYKRYVFLVPLSLLSFFSVSLTPLIISIFILHELRKVDRTVSIILLIIDASMLSWLTLRLLLGINTYFSFPLMILEAGAPTVIPFIWFAGVVFSAYKRDLSSKSQLFINPLIPFIVALLISLVPYFPFINPYKFPETVDFKYYYSWLLSPTLSGWFFYSRPLYLMLLYALSFIFKPYTVAYYEFAFLSILYVYSAYKLASALDKSIASLAALLAAVSPMLITFLYSGLEANLFSISLMFISMSYFLKKEKLSLAILFSLLSMFSHIYAWAQLSASIALYYLLKSIRLKSRPDNYTLTYLSFSIPFIAIGFFLILSGVFPIPMGLLNYNQLIYQIAVVSWGSNNALLYFLLSSFGNKYIKEEVLDFVYSISVFGIIFLAPATNLIIDLPLFIPAAYTIRNIDRQNVSVLLLLSLILWGIYMSINSVPML
ncbi:hypothetical protein [Saccharolobus islandicus]|uniref:Uncharacterized protein n=2 Tax=Saccharolobus islandicus TaxID=43080 RepID=F0NG75_SACI5|nr:hypothetical protein [Sulfolobus islandicus]ADX81502.1 conserved hypothetical protein [Sulfolobus islandicus HVE10/4]ADX84221.1 conserved hypothetical protein [Sulfolobus islandicus REY15A]WCM37115.1 hypothetical protein GO599_06310 [Sulfolobus islandicus]